VTAAPPSHSSGRATGRSGAVASITLPARGGQDAVAALRDALSGVAFTSAHPTALSYSAPTLTLVHALTPRPSCMHPLSFSASGVCGQADKRPA
jgi:hypothetical protein